MLHLFKKKRIYMDHAATTLIDGDVLRAMNRVSNNNYFNPGGLYQEGVTVHHLVHQSRKKVAQLLGTTSDHVIFTRGGTESCNMAVMGVLTPPAYGHLPFAGEEKPHVIASEIEHSAVLETLKSLEKKNLIELTLIPVNEQGIVVVEEIKKALKPETVLVCVMYANNEIGTIQPVKEVSKLVRWYKKQHPSVLAKLRTAPLSKGSKASVYPLVYTDVIQAVNYLDINVEKLGVDLMSLSGSKIYGPKSSGVLYVRNKALLDPIIHGGDQEFGLRAGTEDIAQIVGFTTALEKTRGLTEKESTRLEKLQKYFFELLEKNLTGYVVNGGVNRIPNNINISIQGIPSERLVIELDAQGISASSQSACRSDRDDESYVISALRKSQQSPLLMEEGVGGGGDTTIGSIRFTMGRSTTKSDVERTVKTLVKIVNKIREFEKTIKK